MAITYDPAKRAKILQERGVDIARMGEVLAGDYASFVDDRRAYGEVRNIAAGYLDARLVMFAWTRRGADIHIITARYTHAKEEQRWRRQMGRS